MGHRIFGFRCKARALVVSGRPRLVSADRSLVWKMSATAPLRFPEAVAARVEANDGTRIAVLGLVFRLSRQDRLLADCARPAASVAGPQLHRMVERQQSGIDFVADDLDQRPRHRRFPSEGADHSAAWNHVTSAQYPPAVGVCMVILEGTTRRPTRAELAPLPIGVGVSEVSQKFSYVLPER